MWAWWPGSFFGLFCEHLRGLAALSLPAGLAADLCPGLAVRRRVGVCGRALTASLFLSSEIQKLVLEGRVGEAIETTQRFYPGLLEHNPNLLFMLK